MGNIFTSLLTDIRPSSTPVLGRHQFSLVEIIIEEVELLILAKLLKNNNKTNYYLL